jgi:GNAT superfamily N-acetyltransferase
MDEVVIRRLELSDADAYRALLEGATDEERYFRFFRPVSTVDSSLVEPFVGSPNMLALLAEDRAGRPLGAAHAFLEDEGRRAELAILVAHGSQHHGIGRTLLERLVGELRAAGCATLFALSLDANERFTHLARGLGMRVREHQLGTLTWELRLGPPRIEFASSPVAVDLTALR